MYRYVYLMQCTIDRQDVSDCTTVRVQEIELTARVESINVGVRSN